MLHIPEISAARRFWNSAWHHQTPIFIFLTSLPPAQSLLEAAKIDKNQNSQKNPARSFLDPDFDGESEFQRVRSSKYHLGYDMSVKRPKNTILGRNYNF